MVPYLIRRLLLVPVTLFLVSIVIFVMLRTIPGDVVTMLFAESSSIRDREVQMRMRQEMGLARPVYIQYADWIRHFVTGDLGTSFWYNRPAVAVVKDRFLPTFEIMVLAIVGALMIGIPAGVISAVRQDTWLDYVVRSIAVIGLSLPAFVAAVLILVLLINLFDWVPPAKYVSLTEDPLEHMKIIVWPALVLAYILAAGITRVTRTQVLEVLREDYIRTARAKGLREVSVMLRHALRNALLPVITLAGVYVAHLIGGAVVTETVFNIPGLGQGLYQSANTRDYTVVQLFIILVVLAVMGINLLVDLLYSWIDPRVRYQ